MFSYICVLWLQVILHNFLNMKLCKFFIPLLLIYFCKLEYGNAQKDTLFLDFGAYFDGESLSDFKNDTITFEIFKAYFGKFHILDKQSVIIGSDLEYHLFDFLAENKAYQVKIPFDGKMDRLVFEIGTDSITNVSGAMEGDLDPLNGMYWTWQSGYINFKLEGKHPKSKNRDKSFAFHLGGYLSPFESLRKSEVPLLDSTHIEIQIDVSTLMQNFNWNEKPNIMSPSSRSVELCDLIPQLLKIKE